MTQVTDSLDRMIGNIDHSLSLCEQALELLNQVEIQNPGAPQLPIYDAIMKVGQQIAWLRRKRAEAEYVRNKRAQRR